jgi:hypothetical protein
MLYPTPPCPIVFDLAPGHCVVELPQHAPDGAALELHLWVWGDVAVSAWVTERGVLLAVVDAAEC